MHTNNIEQVRKLIEKEHEGDTAQIEAIFSDSLKMIVEAPAGCGKTKTMVSKIAYLLATEKLSKNKKILALTFSVNAAYKIKKDVSEKLPCMGLASIKTPAEINSKLSISNYHGFARRILSSYGYLLSPNLKQIKEFQSIDDSEIDTLVNLKIGIDVNMANKITDFNKAIKEVNIDEIKDGIEFYVSTVEKIFLPNKIIPYNAYLILFRKLLLDFKKLREFIQKLYPIIIVDEFQDTNILSWQILKLLITSETSVIFMGDSLQRIYGFIGAIPNLIKIAEERYDMEKILLKTNYRFKDNPQMLLLDKNIRANAENMEDPDISEIAKIPFFFFENQDDEACWVADKIEELLRNDDSDKIAILSQQRGKNLDEIIKSLQTKGIPFFYALFSEDDNDYVNYHKESMSIFYEVLRNEKKPRITKMLLSKVIRQLRRKYDGTENKVVIALLELNEIFFEKLCSEYAFLNDEEKLLFISDTFENRALKQNMEYVNSRVIISTVHGAKGLEWQHVLMPDMEQYVFPNYKSLCGLCNFHNNKKDGDYCIISPDNRIEKAFIEELSVFYVSVTRARKQVYFSSSRYRIHNDGSDKRTYISCLLSLPGIEIA